MKIPVVKEWGSWVVYISSLLAAFAAGLLHSPGQNGRGLPATLIPTILGLTFIINSKNPLSATIRTKGRQQEHINWLLFFGITGLILLLPFLLEGLKFFWFFSLLAVSYIVLLFFGKEHHIMTELNGFALLTLSAPVVYFTITGEMSMKLYLAVFLFFAAGVMKVRVRLKKSLFFRVMMVLYCAAALAVFYLSDISLLLLLPLIENIVSVILMKEEKLKVTGYIELTKGVGFIVLIVFFWR
ncbi:MAG: YwiC-like family protein [Nitrospirota bacterium]